jgi:hypothetical protein
LAQQTLISSLKFYFHYHLVPIIFAIQISLPIFFFLYIIQSLDAERRGRKISRNFKKKENAQMAPHFEHQKGDICFNEFIILRGVQWK